MRFQNGSTKVAIELQVVQFWSEIILVRDFEITLMISDQIAQPEVQLPLYILPTCVTPVAFYIFWWVPMPFKFNTKLRISGKTRKR